MILPNGGDEDYFYNADKRDGDCPQFPGHRQVVESPQHHQHYPKAEEAVLELFELFEKLIVLSLELDPLVKEFDPLVEEGQEEGKQDYGESHGIEDRPPGIALSHAGFEIRNYKPQCHYEDHNSILVKILHFIMFRTGSQDHESHGVEEVHSTVTDEPVDWVGKEIDEFL